MAYITEAALPWDKTEKKRIPAKDKTLLAPPLYGFWGFQSGLFQAFFLKKDLFSLKSITISNHESMG